MTNSNYTSNCAKSHRAVSGREEAAARNLTTVHTGTLSHGRFWVDGHKMTVARNYEAMDGHNIGGKRGKITGFSKQARRRFMLTLGQIKKDHVPLFLTLTLPDEAYPYIQSVKWWKAALKRFDHRFTRAFPGGAIIGRVELKDRKSGQYVGAIFPHFHLLVWGVTHEDLITWVGDAWWESCGKLSEDHRVRGWELEVLRSSRGVMSYVSKYMAKVEDYNQQIGRVWFIIGKGNIPWDHPVMMQFTEQESVHLMRYMRRYAHIKGKDRKSMSILCNVDFWYYRIADILSGLYLGTGQSPGSLPIIPGVSF